ncbi:MAG: glycerol-3-phosphate 1-O-acyltransferase PlsY [Puniceicoccales bacterium]|jgi:glycerol-3-phosphate acyltransferase PlsY|nr:glycerol-3-phosphate 1-O-acyltransferase PlsY [Puniceicoccales bacterium]
MASFQWNYLCIAAVGYVLGSIPWGALIAKFNGVNILNRGSGSSGATNVKREVGKMAGNLVFFLDALKGMAAVWIAQMFPGMREESAYIYAFIGLFFALIGHSFSIFLKLRGGKGVSLTIGGLVLLAPSVLAFGILTWLVVFFTTRIVSLASICFSLILPLCVHLFFADSRMTYPVTLLSVFILMRHFGNMRRLASGTEYRFHSDRHPKP